MVVCMAASKHHNLVATANTFGYFSIWELDSARIVCVQKISNEKITLLSFMDKYPILIAGDCHGLVTVWAVKSAPIEIRNRCLGRFQNFHLTDEPAGNQILGISCGVSHVLEVKSNHSF